MNVLFTAAKVVKVKRCTLKTCTDQIVISLEDDNEITVFDPDNIFKE